MLSNLMHGEGKIGKQRPKLETERTTLIYRGLKLWYSLNSDRKIAENLLNFNESLTKYCKIIEQISLSKGTAVNANKDLHIFVYI